MMIFLDGLNLTNDDNHDDDIDDWIKPLLFEHDFQQNIFNLNDMDIKQEKSDNEKFNSLLLNNFTPSQQIIQENELIDLFHQSSSEQQLPTTTTTTTTTTVRLIHQPKIEPTDIPTTVYLTGNELQFHPILTTNNNNNNTINTKTIGQTFTNKVLTTTTSSPIPSVPIVPARVLKGKKFKRGGRVTSRTSSRNNAAKRRLNSTAAEPKASVVIIAEDATRIDSKTTTLGLSSSSASDTDLLKTSTNSSTRSSTRRRVKSTPREVILFRNGTFISKEPISKQQTTTQSNANNCPPPPPPLHQQQITATGLQAAAQIVACNVLRQATLNDALIEQLIKRETTNTEDDYPIYCYSTPSLSSSSSCTMTTALDEYENSCSTTLKILGCNTTAPPPTTTTTIELLTFAALQQKQQQPQQTQQQQQFCYIKQEPITTTTTTTTFLLPRLLTH